jgi:hypothetical protein
MRAASITGVYPLGSMLFRIKRRQTTHATKVAAVTSRHIGENTPEIAVPRNPIFGVVLYLSWERAII